MHSTISFLALVAAVCALPHPGEGPHGYGDSSTWAPSTNATSLSPSSYGTASSAPATHTTSMPHETKYTTYTSLCTENGTTTIHTHSEPIPETTSSSSLSSTKSVPVYPTGGYGHGSSSASVPIYPTGGHGHGGSSRPHSGASHGTGSSSMSVPIPPTGSTSKPWIHPVPSGSVSSHLPSGSPPPLHNITTTHSLTRYPHGPSKSHGGHGGSETCVTFTTTYPVTATETHSLTYSYPIGPSSLSHYRTTHATTVITQTRMTTAVTTSKLKPSKPSAGHGGVGSPSGPDYTTKQEMPASSPAVSVGPVTTVTGGYTCPIAQTVTMKVPEGSSCECPAQLPPATITVTETVVYGSMSAAPTWSSSGHGGNGGHGNPQTGSSTSLPGHLNNATTTAFNGTTYTPGPTASPTTTYACNPAHQYPAGTTCTSISGSLTLITPTASSSIPSTLRSSSSAPSASSSSTVSASPRLSSSPISAASSATSGGEEPSAYSTSEGVMPTLY